MSIEEVSPGIHRIPLDVPFDTEPVNVYLVEGDPPALVDAGISRGASPAPLEEGLRQAGRRLEEIGQLFITHGHIDHHGLLGAVLNRSRAEFLVREEEFPELIDMPAAHKAVEAEYLEIFRYWGLDPGPMRRFRDSFFAFYAPMPSDARERARLLTDGEVRFLFAGRAARAIHTPGHSEGHACLFLEEEGILFTSDHLLQRITSNPSVYVPRYRGARTGLGDYLRSLEAIRDLPVRLVLPGHGPAFAGLRERVDAILAHHRERSGTVRSSLNGDSHTITGIARRLWPDLDLQNTFLACREVHGHLELLESSGLVRHDLKDGTAQYRTT